MVNEQWKWIAGYEDMYKVSNYGRVKSVGRYVYCEVSPNKLQYITGRMLKQGFNHKGYPIVYLSKNGKQKTITVHRLVAKAFIENPLKLPQVNHIDCDKTNNYFENLEWCTNSENQIHAYAHELHPSYDECQEPPGRPPKPVAMLDLVTGDVIREFSTLAEAGRETHINKFNIRSVCVGQRHKAGGYGWKFI